MRHHLTLPLATVALTALMLSGCATTKGEAEDRLQGRSSPRTPAMR